MQLTNSVQPTLERCPDKQLSTEFVDPPPRFVDPANEMRLVNTLRDCAMARDPYVTLAHAAEAFARAQGAPAGAGADADMELGNALADLAATGRRSYCLLATPARTPLDELSLMNAGSYVNLRTQPYTAAQLHREIGKHIDSALHLTAAQQTAAIDAALDRTFSVAWALRGPVAERRATRAALGWIAVSSEDDMAHRPVNTPAPPYEQYEIPVTVPAFGPRKAHTLQTRFFIASPPAAAVTPPAHTLRELPPDPVPDIPDDNNVILFLHGHASGAEEALTVIPYIHMAGLIAQKKYSVISVDLPNSGYSEDFDHETIATSDETWWPWAPTDHGPIRTPILDFIEDFVVAFVDALDQITPIKGRFAGVFGGSLGGNLGLRLGRRNPMPAWLDSGIVSWNAASVWDPMVQDLLKSIGPGNCKASWEASEMDDSRRGYFHEVFDKVVIPIIVPFAQPQLWYRDGWNPCKALHIKGARIARREVYSSNLRKWHWRVAGEQLVYSHVDRVSHDDNTTSWRYELNVVNQLLIGSEGDNYSYSNIYDATRNLAKLMTNTPGRSLFLRNTGHSVHFERPAYLAKQIVEFLPSPASPTTPAAPLSLEITCTVREAVGPTARRPAGGKPHYGKILMVSGTEHTQDLPFSLTVDECVQLLDAGSEAFVAAADGTRIAVIAVHTSGTDAHLATVHNPSQTDNLLSLPQC